MNLRKKLLVERKRFEENAEEKVGWKCRFGVAIEMAPTIIGRWNFFYHLNSW
jgi:hypothetical protein